MVSIAIAILWLLVGLCVVVGVYYVAVWVFAQLGIPIPAMALKIVLIIIGLIALIYLIGILSGGGGFRFPLAGR